MKKKYIALFIFFIATFSGLLFGLDLGIITGALLFIVKEFNINIVQEQWIVSSMMLGAIIGVIFSGLISSYFSRNTSFVFASNLFIIRAIFSSQASNFSILFLARILLVIVTGITSYISSIYLSEVTAKNCRGRVI